MGKQHVMILAGHMVGKVSLLIKKVKYVYKILEGYISKYAQYLILFND